MRFGIRRRRVWEERCYLDRRPRSRQREHLKLGGWRKAERETCRCHGLGWGQGHIPGSWGWTVVQAAVLDKRISKDGYKIRHRSEAGKMTLEVIREVRSLRGDFHCTMGRSKAPTGRVTYQSSGNWYTEVSEARLISGNQVHSFSPLPSKQTGVFSKT